MYKLIALDMDGTLLNSEKQISPRTQAAIAAAREAGVKVVLASGRPLKGMQSKLDQLNIAGSDEFVVYCNGALVKDLGTQQAIHNEIIDGKAAKEVARLAQQFGLFTHAFSTEHGLISPRNNEYTHLEVSFNQLELTELDFESLEDNHPIIKSMIVGEPSKLTQAVTKIPQEIKSRFTVVQSAPFFLEFLSLNANKGIAVEAIANHLGIKAHEVICVGDAENDNHMIEFAGLGVAMENAMEDTKQLANYITSTNDEDGVAKVIEKFILSEQ